MGLHAGCARSRPQTTKPPARPLVLGRALTRPATVLSGLCQAWPSLCLAELAHGRPTILRSIVRLAEELGMDVVAEGAETESEAIELYQIGCDYAQGFVFGEPMTAAQARQLVGASLADAA